MKITPPAFDQLMTLSTFQIINHIQRQFGIYEIFPQKLILFQYLVNKSSRLKGLADSLSSMNTADGGKCSVFIYYHFHLASLCRGHA
jgi:hypothetical protein